MSNTLSIALKDPDATYPTKGDPNGYDLYSCEDIVIKAGESELVNIGIIAYFPFGTYGRIGSGSDSPFGKDRIEVEPGIIKFSKFQLTMTKGIQLNDNCIYMNYDGIVKVAINNHTDDDYEITIGERIAQLFVVKLKYCDIEVDYCKLSA